jgi:hypothetical protein
MVYIKYKGAVFDELKAAVNSPGDFVVFDGDGVSGFERKTSENIFDTLRTFAACDMYVDLKVLKLSAVSHPAGHIHMIFKLLYASIYNIWVIAGQYRKLTRMKTQSNVTVSSYLAYFGKCPFSICTHIGLLPKVSPSRFSIYRKYITAEPYHPEVPI